MYTTGLKTCRYCEYLWTKYCPFSAKEIKEERTVNGLACGQFMVLSNVNEFYQRNLLDQFTPIKKRQEKEIKGPSKRAIEF